MSVKYLLNTRTKTVLVATEALLAHGGKHLIPYDPDQGAVMIVDPAVAGYVARIKDLEAQVIELQSALDKAVEVGSGISMTNAQLAGVAAPNGAPDQVGGALPAGDQGHLPADFNRITMIADAIRTLTPDQFTTTGLPRADALEGLCGKTTAEERQQAMELNKQLKE